MRFRRIWSVEFAEPQLQYHDAGTWQDMPRGSLPLPSILTLPEAVSDDSGLLLPLRPISFRDFMLYERHAIDAARGYVRHFMPRTYRVTRAYERLTRRTFPGFRPKPLWYRQPIYYMGNHLAFVPSGTPVSTPGYSRALDYELELGFILSHPLFNASLQEALDAIGAFVVLCDFSARDVQRLEMQSGFGPQKSKHFLSSMSAEAVTADEILPNEQKLSATVEIDGEVVVRTSTAGMQHRLAEALVHASKDEYLYAGELFGTGTLPGGSGMENGRWLKRGSSLRLSIDGVGEILHDIL